MKKIAVLKNQVALVVGASAGVGRALAEALAENSCHLILCSSQAEDLKPLQSDLSLRFGVRVEIEVVDLSATDWSATQFFNLIQKKEAQIHRLFIPAGWVSSHDHEGPSREVIDKTFRVNTLSILQLLSESWRRRKDMNLQSVVLFSSIAAFVPRRRNLTYAAAKAALEIFARGLRHELQGERPFIQIYSLGYVDTSMSFGQKLLFPVASPQKLAEVVLENLECDFGQKHWPRFWGVVVFILRLLPWTLYRRLKF